MAERQEILLFVHSSIELPEVKNELRTLRASPVYDKLNLQENGATGFDDLDRALRNQNNRNWITMLHYAGHSFEDGIIVEENGVHKVLGIDALKTMIKAHKAFRFVFLNSCNSAEMAKAFLEAGVPFVVGTTGKVKDTDALLVAERFYECIGRSSCSIPDAFQLTNEYFIQHKDKVTATFSSFSDKLNTHNGYRTLQLKNGGKESEYPWMLYIREDIAAASESAARTADENKLLDKTYNWTLVPQHKYEFELSNDLNGDYQNKVLCLYTKRLGKYYTAFRNRLSTPGKQDTLIQGVWELFGKEAYDQEAFEKELEAAHAVVHLIEGPDHLQEIYMTGTSLQKINNKKAHAHMSFAAVQDVTPFQAMDWYNRSIELKANENAKNMGDDFLKLVRKMNARDQPGKMQDAMVFYRESFSSFVFGHTDTADPDLLSEELINMPFDTEQLHIANIFNTCQEKLFFSHVEGTANCAQALIIQKIRESKGIPSNVSSIRVSLLKPTPIITTEAFWEEMMRVTGTPKLGNKANYPAKCIDSLLGKLQQHDVVIVLEDYTDAHLDLYQHIQQVFWQNLVKEFKANNTGSSCFENTLLFIIVNYHKDVNELPSFMVHDETASFKISPVTCISQTEWKRWYVKEDIFLKKLPHKDKYYRKEVMIDICNSLRIKPNIIEEKVLKYD